MDNDFYNEQDQQQEQAPQEENPYYYHAPEMNDGWQPPEPQPEPQPSFQTPPQPRPEPPKKEKKKHMGLRIACVAVVCALVGSIGGGAIVGSILNKQMKQNQAEWEKAIASAQAVTQNTENTTPVIRPVVNQEGMTPAEVYSANVDAVVGILNESTSTGRNIFGQPITNNTASSGSGFIISPDGEILTNYHVVEGATTLTVTLHDGTEYAAQILGYESESDVALIKIDGQNLPTVTLGSSEALTVGAQVAAIGNPLGELTYSMTVGYVSAMDRAVNTDGNPINMMQIDAAINSGNSGGPLFNMAGEVVGITTAKYSGSTSSGTSIEGIGFAIPIDDVLSILEDLRTTGSVQNRAYIGIGVGDVSQETAEAYGLPMGALVSSVDEGTSGAKAGLQKSDIITGLDNYEITSRETLTSALKHYRAGDTATLTVYRAGRYLKLEITFDARPAQTEPEITEATENYDYGDDSYDFFGNGDAYDFFYGWPFG